MTFGIKLDHVVIWISIEDFITICLFAIKFILHYMRSLRISADILLHFLIIDNDARTISNFHQQEYVSEDIVYIWLVS